MTGILLENIGVLAGMFALLCASGTVSGSESAIFSISDNDVRFSPHQNDRINKALLYLTKNSSNFLAVALFLNNAVNVAFFTLSARLAGDLATGHSVPHARTIVGVVSLLMLVTFGEMLPKMIAVRYPMSVSSLVAIGWSWATKLIYPVLAPLIDGVVRKITGFFSVEKSRIAMIGEMKHLIDMHKNTGVLSAEEEQILSEIVELGHDRVREIMLPRTNFALFDLRDPATTLRKIFADSRQALVVAHEGDPDKPIGAIFAKDLIFNGATPRDMVKTLSFVPEAKTVESMFDEFQKNTPPAAFVIDEYGEVTGVVTVEHIYAEIMGEVGITSGEQPGVAVLSDGKHRLSGADGVRDFFARLGVASFPEGVDTIGGLVFAKLGRVPRRGDAVITKWGTFRVLHVRKRVAAWVLFEPCAKNGTGGPE